MTVRKSLAARIRRGEPIPAPIALALSTATAVQRLGMAVRRTRQVHRVDARVISFGNITAGGTGKTPATIERARHEIAAGRRVAVLTRGYAAPSGRKPLDSTQFDGLTPYQALGDEAALVLQKVPGVIVVKNADRVAGAHRAIALGCNTLILDDGFQYLRLARDEDIVLIDAANPFGGGHLLPRGILREPFSALSRATHLIVTHADAVTPETLAALDARLKKFAPNAAIRHTTHAPVSLRNVHTNERLPLDWLRGRAVDLACAIADPTQFIKTVESLGARIERAAAGADHASIGHAFEVLTGEAVLITEKDAARGNFPPRKNIYALEIALRDTTR